MRNASGHNYWNSLFIMDVAMHGADTTFHRTHFQFSIFSLVRLNMCRPNWIFFSIVVQTSHYMSTSFHPFFRICVCTVRFSTANRPHL